MVKSFTVEVDKVSKSICCDANEELQKARCKAFQQNIKGIVFYGVPHMTSTEEFVEYCKFFNKTHIYFFIHEYFDEIVQDLVSLNVEFENSIEINLLAFVEGQKVQSCGYLSSFVGFSSLGQSLVS
jgi:hypothetical protein